MNLTTYIYKGPHSGATLHVDKDVLEVRLIPGKPVKLPAEHEYTKVLLELEHLVPAPAEKATAPKGGK
ncbi:hypothetical protein LOY46_11300 [Pseudomonas sichuanensis]|uniref:hypothetical protein n=1 Tax=Pseudomonas sichuanensis TaxID=2213015 RepID=UPI00215F49E1|nr:hypothetical protein [Pseudomonas sichuanensis]UVK85230.1 hypothetical protein LOY46_11300 [Pseudomonas sichuanensis]